MTRIASATWRRLDTPGTDTCSLLSTDEGWALAGLAEFEHEEGPARITYRVDCGPDWVARSCEIRGTIGPRRVADRIHRDGTWTVNGRVSSGADAIIDVDFGFTPATNFILMRRLTFPFDQPIAVSVAWFDLGEKDLTVLPQRYTRRGAKEFWYESPTVRYEGLLTLDAAGFVENYPGLWVLER